MRLISISILLLLLSSLNISAQTKIITGKIIDEFDLHAIWGIRIQNSDTLLLAETDRDGKFKIEIPANEHSLLISGVGYEWTTINFKNTCDHFDIILMELGTYDFISLKKVDKLRMKRFKKLPEFHLTAYKKGIFAIEQPCYEKPFIPESTRKNKKTGD
jgi:CarboxypepD_reg-like domain